MSSWGNDMSTYMYKCMYIYIYIYRYGVWLPIVCTTAHIKEFRSQPSQDAR